MLVLRICGILISVSGGAFVYKAVLLPGFNPVVSGFGGLLLGIGLFLLTVRPR